MLDEVRELDVWEGSTVHNTFGGFDDQVDFDSDASDGETE